jgi:hypothetical protein
MVETSYSEKFYRNDSWVIICVDGFVINNVYENTMNLVENL